MYISVPRTCLMPSEVKESIRSLILEWQIVGRHHLGAGTKPIPLQEKQMHFTTEPSLQLWTYSSEIQSACPKAYIWWFHYWNFLLKTRFSTREMASQLRVWFVLLFRKTSLVSSTHLRRLTPSSGLQGRLHTCAMHMHIQILKQTTTCKS